MNRIVLFSIFTLFCSVSISGANYHHHVQGRVADKITGEAIPAKIYLMNPDSTVIDTTTSEIEENPYMGRISIYVFDGKINQKGHYIIKAVMPNYKDAYVDFELKSLRQTFINIKPIFMEHDYIELPEVMVKATKIKMVMRGDTIVYNADAFNLAEGSMLNALVSRLPGAQLTKDGQIFVNGKHIQSLLINGRDFFNGNPKLALENLPSYTVHRIKVYNKKSEVSRLTQRDMGDDSFVMDVKLKKEYDATLFGNLAFGMGTKNRFAQKGFIMKSSQKEMLFAFTNINNLNDNQTADMSGQWSPQETPNGLLTKYMANVSYGRFFDSNMDKWVTTQNTISHDKADNETRRNTEIFLPSGNMTKRLESEANTKTTVFDSHNTLQYREVGKYSFMTNLNFHYTHNRKHGENYTTSSEKSSLLNELIEKVTDRGNHYNVLLKNSSLFHCITDLLRTGFSIEYDKRDGDLFSLYNLTYADVSIPHDFRNNYRQLESHFWDLKGHIGYDWQWPGWSLRPEYQYNYKYNKTNHELFRLDRLDDREDSRYDLLPSARAVLLSVTDRNNSYLYREYQNHHRLMLEWCINAASGANHLKIDYGYIRLPLRMISKNLRYLRVDRHNVSKKATFFEPELYFRSGLTTVWEFWADIKSEIPNLVNMVDYHDDSDPLYLISGNPNLRNIHRYHAMLSLRHQGMSQHIWNASLEFNKVDNDIAYATLYDTHTGIATMMPVSVNGNWRTEGVFDYSLPLDSARKWTLDNHLFTRYNHNVDMTTTQEGMGSIRSVVNNWQWGGRAKLNYRPNDKYEFTLHGSVTRYYINSRREGFNSIHAGDYRVGFETELRLPWDLSLGSDIILYVRRGYQDSRMNTTEWVWNAHLQRSFLKGALTAKVIAFDLFHQLSNTKYEMNEQGRTETWYNSVPRYLLFSLAWKFNVNPKKKTVD